MSVIRPFLNHYFLISVLLAAANPFGDSAHSATTVLLPLPIKQVASVSKSEMKNLVKPDELVAAKPVPDYEEEVLQPFREKRDAALVKVKADCEAKKGTADEFTCVMPPPPPPPSPAPEPVQYGAGYGGSDAALIGGLLLTGTIGYSLPYGNCVDEVKAIGKNQPGNPISWVPTTQVAEIGEAVLFYYNHTARVTGWWSNGDIEVAQQNCPSCPHRIPRSEIRGFF